MANQVQRRLKRGREVKVGIVRDSNPGLCAWKLDHSPVYQGAPTENFYRNHFEIQIEKVRKKLTN